MLDFWSKLFDTTDFPARWHCGRWTSGHGWLHVLSDLGVFGAYLALPAVLSYFAFLKRDLPFRRIFWLFGAFILFCGVTHLMEAVIFWWPAYRLAGVIKLATAVASWATVAALIPIVPRAFALRSPELLEREIEERKKVEEELQAMRRDLERRVAERTEELSRANAALQAEVAVRTHVEHVLAGQREWFEVTFDSIRDAVIAADIQGNVMFMNAAAYSLLGVSGNVAGQPLEKVFQTRPDPTIVADPANLTRTPAAQGGETSLLLTARGGAAQGGMIPIEHQETPIVTPQGEKLGTAVVFRDISERRAAEEALLRANRHKDQFLAMLGHELRNPLAGITGAIQVLEAIGATNEDALEMRRIIQRQTAHMARLIDDLLEVSRISRGKLQLRIEAVDLTTLVRATVEDFRQTVAGSDRTIRLQAAVPPLWVRGDSTRLAQILVNLLQNADKFSNPGDAIDVTLTHDPKENRAELRVRDPGIGMTPQTLAEIFEPFRQADQTLDRSRGGLGLGLALVRGLVQLHGGEIAAHSAGLGQGSQFTVRLPLTDPAPQPATPAADLPVEDMRYRVLIIDDRRDAAMPLRVLLEKLGHQVELASDGPAGVDAAEVQLPDLILCDIGLPGELDGYGVARALRHHAGLRHTYLVAVTGYGQEEDRRLALEAGFHQHLTKPVSLEMLRQVLAEMRERPQLAPQ